MNKKQNSITFYSIHGPHGCFSNFSDHSFSFKGYTYKTSEHAFQSLKFEGTKFEKKVRQAASPLIAAKLGRNREFPLRKNWEQIKVQLMEDIVYAKFSQNQDLGELLVSTGNAKIVEKSLNDDFWGDGGDGSGKNMLGIILMRVRERIKSEQKQ